MGGKIVDASLMAAPRQCGMAAKKAQIKTDHNHARRIPGTLGLVSDYPIVAPNYAATRRDMAVKLGLGHKPGTRKDTRAKR